VDNVIVKNFHLADLLNPGIVRVLDYNLHVLVYEITIAVAIN